jgi:hypothetical protein
MIEALREHITHKQEPLAATLTLTRLPDIHEGIFMSS